MKRFFSLLLILCLSSSLFAQLRSFDLSSYKMPEILTRRLDFSGYLNGAQNNNYYHVNPSDPPGHYDKTYNNTLNGNGNASFYQFKNTERFQGSIDARAHVYLGRRWYNYIAQDAKRDSTYQFDIWLNVQNRWYGKNKWFFECGINTQPSYIQNGSYKVIENNNEMSLLFGKGRIEPVEDARLAVYILQDLEKSNRLNRIPNNEEILEFAQKISELKNQRFFDHRLRRIYELKSIDSLLSDKEIVNENDIVYYTHLTDNWGFSGGPPRWTGTRISGGLKTYNGYIRQTTNEPLSFAQVLDFFYHDLKFGPTIKAEWQKPLNLYWQRKIVVSSLYVLPTVRELLENTIINEPGDELVFWTNMQLSYNYYPNSRTSMGAASNIDIYTTKDIVAAGSEVHKELVISPRINLYFDYYFSPQLSMNATYNLGYGYSRTNLESTNTAIVGINRTQNFNQSFSVSLLYSIF